MLRTMLSPASAALMLAFGNVGEFLLANAQYDWLASDGAALGSAATRNARGRNR
jgi:hypothetical protein